MNWLKSSRQRVAGALAVLLLALMLAACGTPANAANTGGSQGAGVQQQPQQTQQTRQSQPTNSNGTGTGIRSTDQQVQSLLRQLDGAQSDVNNADGGVSQDSGQP